MSSLLRLSCCSALLADFCRSADARLTTQDKQCFVAVVLYEQRGGLSCLPQSPHYSQAKSGILFRSARKKRSLFPDLHTYGDSTPTRDMRSLTRNVIFPHSGFAALHDFFDSYSLTGERLSRLRVTVSILAAADDPVVPVTEFRQLSLPGHSYLEISTWDGHCGFIMDSLFAGFAERWVSARLLKFTSAAPEVAEKRGGLIRNHSSKSVSARDLISSCDRAPFFLPLLEAVH